MNLMGLFRSPQNELEKGGKPVPEEDAGIRTTCGIISASALGTGLAI